MTYNSKKDNPKSNKKSEKFYIINNVFKFSSKPDVHYNVASHLIGTGGEGLGAGNFTWPEYKSERERIKWNTCKYADHTIIEAFEEEYNTPINTDNPMIENTPGEMRIGDVFTVDIIGARKRHVEFGSNNVKANLFSTVDLYKYPAFKDNFEPKRDIKALVVDVNKDEARVDVISPMLNDFINPIISKPWIQKKLNNAQPIKVKNLKLTRGGFLGKAVIPNVSDFIGTEYEVDAFIPGSHIVLNITDNFEKFIGSTVETFIVNYIKQPNTGTMSLICSAKEYLKYKGDCAMIEMFKNWCDNNKIWEATTNTNYVGKVTGVINSSKKCGVFVELPELNITGMIAVPPIELVNFKPNQAVNVKIVGFEEEMFFNQQAQQLQHVDPYKIKDDCIEQCTLKPILELV